MPEIIGIGPVAGLIWLVLVNLADDAVEFTHERSVRIHIDASESADGIARFGFTLELPVVAKPDTTTTVDPTRADEAPLAGYILIAEDNRVNQRVAEELLARLGRWLDGQPESGSSQGAPSPEDGRATIQREVSH